MDISRVAPELRRVARYPFRLLEYAWARRSTRLLARLKPPARMKGVTIEAVKGKGIPPLRIYRPAVRRTDAALIWMHGGGYMVGSARLNDYGCSDICRTLGMTVVSVDYRLGPKYRFPIPSNDCLAAWYWLQRSAAFLGVDPARVAIGGASAGGGLAAGLAQRIHDAGGIQPIAQWLLAPMLDDRTAARRELDAVRHFVWNNRMNRAGWRAYLGREPGSDNVPAYAVPARRDDLSGLPPAFIGVGDIDLFYDEAHIYADRLRQHGVAVTFETVEGAPHGFDEVARKSKLARTYFMIAKEWLGIATSAGTSTHRLLRIERSVAVS